MTAVTQKPLMFPRKALIALAVPIVLDAIMALLAGLVDSAMVSSAGETAVSGVSLVDAINVLFIYAFAAVASGGAVVTAQYIGSRDLERARRSANQLLYASTAISLIFMILLLSFLSPVLRLIYGSIEPAVFEHAKTYFFITLLGYPFCALGNAGTALLRVMARSRQALWITAASNIFNIAGNAFFIYVLDMGVAGAAIATTLSRVFWAAISLWMLHDRRLPVYFENLLKFRIDADIMRRVLKIGLANGLENWLFQFGRVLIASLVSSFGTISIAAYSVSTTLCNIGWAIICSFGTVLLTVVGQCIGADEIEQAKMYTKKISRFALVLNYVIYGLIFLLRGQLVQLFAFGPEALEAAALHTGLCAAAGMISVYAYSFVPISAYRAAGDTRYAVTLAVSSMFTFRLGLSFVLCRVFDMGLVGIWVGTAADWGFRAAMNVWRYYSGRWLTKKVI